MQGPGRRAIIARARVDQHDAAIMLRLHRGRQRGLVEADRAQAVSLVELAPHVEIGILHGLVVAPIIAPRSSR